MNSTRKGKSLVLGIVGTFIALYVLFPFYLVVMNAFKKQTDIVADPVRFRGVSFAQLLKNLNSVIHNSNFNFWYAFGTSTVITIVSLVLLVLFGSMAAWVISRNHKKAWATAIYMVFIASMIIPFQVVMLPLVSTFRDVGKFIGIGMLQSVQGIVFAYLGFGGAMTVFILTGFITGDYDGDDFKRNVDLERLPSSVSDAWTKRKGEDAPCCRAGLCRFLCKTVGSHPFGCTACHFTHDYCFPDWTKADYERNG